MDPGQTTDDGNSGGTLSKRGQCSDRNLWGQHLTNLLARLGHSAATLVDWNVHQVDVEDVNRISVEPSSHPEYDTKADPPAFWWRRPVSTEAITDEAERDRIIADRWA